MHAVEDAGAVDVDQVAPLFRILVLDLGEPRDAGIVDETVDLPMRGFPLCDRRAYSVTAGSIGTASANAKKAL